MGLLNFRKKNKKNSILKDSLPKLTCENYSSASTNSGMSPESYSPVVNSFMTVSSISDVTSSSLLDEILNELPSPKRSLNSSSGSETSSARNIRHSLNLNSNHSNNSPIKNFNVKEKDTTTSAKVPSLPRVLTSANPHHISKDPHNTTRIKADTISTDFSNSSDESESDSLSIDSLSTTEDHPPPHPISWSDSRFSPGFIAKKQEDTTPLMELMSRSYAGNTLPIGAKSKESIKEVAVISDNETDSPANPRSSGFAIDRMKERHRQEYRRSISYTPSEAESRLISTQRSNPQAISNPHHSIALSHENQRLRSAMITNNQVNIPLINCVETRSNRMAPKKSFSTSTSNFFNSHLLGNIANNQVNPKPVSTYTITQSTKQINHQNNDNTNKHYNSSKSSYQNGNTSNFKSNQATISVCNMRQLYHVNPVPPTFDSSGKKNFMTNEKIVKNGPSQSFFCPETNNRKGKHMGNELRQDNGSLVQVIPEESFTGCNDLLQIHVETRPTLRKEYRRMQQIHKNKYHSVPNLQHLQDNGKLEKDLRRNPLETNMAEAKIINKKNFNQRMKSEKIQAKNIYDVSENQQHYNNKFIYRYSHTPQHLHNHQKKCHYHQRQPEPSCSCKCIDKQQKYSNHQVKIRQPRKPLLLLTPFEPSSAKNHQGPPQHQIKLNSSCKSRYF